jgi:hypothetical protein
MTHLLQPLVLAAGGVVGAEPEDKEALCESPTEESTALRGDIVGQWGSLLHSFICNL